MATPLFSQQHTGRQGTSIAGALMEFKAGRLFRDGTTNWVRADTRKGLCYIKKEDDGLMRFCWKDRQSGTVEEELIVFPGDITFEKVPQAGARVYVLKFKSSSQRQFFWFQQHSEEAEFESIASAVNALLSGDEDEDAEEMDDDTDVRMLLGQPIGPTEGAPVVGRRNSREGEVLSRHREQSALAQENYGAPHALPSAQVGGVPGNNLGRGQRPGSDITRIGGGNLPTGGRRDLGGLRQLLEGVTMPEAYTRSNNAVNLGDILTAERLAPVLEDETLRRTLFPHLPEGMPHNKESVEQVVRSPQFQQALNSLSYALESGQIAPLVTQLGLPASASSSVLAFLEAIQAQVKEERDSHDDEEMHE